ncbi:MAG: PEP-CTERM sorting domain-containing protein [Planctomycetaceae bacterium]|nr:PEP-CTERM sorting domain-containing protein [Planctomycetaceae bacterium]
MNADQRQDSSLRAASLPIEGRLAAYLAAVGGGVALAADAEAAVVANTTVQPFGVNQEVNIDFNNDGQVDFQVDHDRVDANGSVLDYLQIDKNDVNGAANPLVFPTGTETFPIGATIANDQGAASYVAQALGSYPSALNLNDVVGPASFFDFQEGNNFNGTGKAIRANRLVDEDATQIDQILGGRTAAQVQVPSNGPNFGSVAGEVDYIGLRMKLNGSSQFNYGWVGVRIDSQADATGAVVGYAYESTPNVPIKAGAVPEPSSALLALAGGIALVGAAARRRLKSK